VKDNQQVPELNLSFYQMAVRRLIYPQNSIWSVFENFLLFTKARICTLFKHDLKASVSPSLNLLKGK
jgi:hypothetical protein